MFIDEIKKICSNYNRVAFFIDMDGTIVEYKVFENENELVEAHKNLLDEKPLLPIINILKEINKLPNIDLYILSLAKNTQIKEEKKQWLNKYASFIKPNNWIILNKEYDYEILLDDDHKILKVAKQNLQKKGKVFHISSTLV